MNRGSLIVFEGIDRSGKTTQARLLYQRLAGKAELMKFPNDSSPLGQHIRKILSKEIEAIKCPQTMHLLFTANRWEYSQQINDILDSGKHVIIDRYSVSGMVYSIANGLSLSWVQNAENGLPIPDITVFLDITPESASQRTEYGNDLYENIDFQRKVYQTYGKFLNSSWIIIDAEKKSIAEISDIVYNHIIDK